MRAAEDRTPREIRECELEARLALLDEVSRSRESLIIFVYRATMPATGEINRAYQPEQDTKGLSVDAVKEATPTRDALFEEVIKDIGPWGRWQKWTAVMNGLMSVVAAIQTLSYPMLAGKFSVSCSVSELESLAWTPGQRSNFSTPTTGNDIYKSCYFVNFDYASIAARNLTFDEAIREYHVGNFSTDAESCYDGSGEFNYQSDYYTKSLKNDFQLVCDRLWLESSVHSTFTIGCMIGVFVFG